MRRDWRADPAQWGVERLKETYWSKQRDAFAAVRDYRKVSIQSCHSVGKSFLAARLAGWWLDIHPPGDAFVVTTAPTYRQVRSILWREISRVQAKGLLGRTNQTEWLASMPNGKEELVAIGFKPSDYDPTAFQGLHAENFLVLVDEACGIASGVLDSLESLAANDRSKLVYLGNPDDPDTEFFKLCSPGSGVHVIQIGAFDTPAFTGEEVPRKLLWSLIGRVYVEEKRKKWAPSWYWVDAAGARCEVAEGVRCVPPEGQDPADTNPLWQSKVLGLFPQKSSPDALIPMSWIRAAQQRELPPSEPNELGVDVGGGGDANTIASRKGPVVRVIHEDQNPNTMETCGNVVTARRKTGATAVKIDKIGIGAGLVDKGKEDGEPFVGINVGEAAHDKEAFANLRAELWWGVRERFEEGNADIDPLDDDLAGELASLKFTRTSKGQVLIESKDQAKRRGIPSPNKADAVMLAFAPIPEEQGGLLLW